MQPHEEIKRLFAFENFTKNQTTYRITLLLVLRTVATFFLRRISGILFATMYLLF